MKKLFLLLAILGMVAVGCTTEGGNEQNDNYLSFTDETNTNPTVVAGGGMVNISFTTEYDWKVTSNADWLTTSKTSGVGGSVDFFITASPNKSDKERKGTITITLSNGKSYEIVVTQEPNEGIKHLVCQANEILYTTKYNYVIEKDFAGVTGFGDTNATFCVESGYDGTYGYIRFNNDVTKIPAGAFAECTSVEAIYLPDGVQEVGKGAFGGCTALHSIYSINSVDDYKALVIDGTLCAVAPAKLTEYTIPTGVKKIGAGAFSGCKTLKKVIIPEGVKEIEAGAFEDCENLEYIKIPNSLTVFGGDIITGTCNENFGLDISSDHPNVLIYATSDNKPIDLYNDDNILAQTFSNGIGLVFYWKLQIPSSTFYNCDSLTSVTIPDSVTSIGSEAFCSCNSLTSIVIPDSVTLIDREAFYNCTSLTSVTIGNGVTSIGSEAFYNCNSLTSVKIPDGVTSIGGSAFSGCDSLTSVTIGNGVTSIGSSAFSGCSGRLTINSKIVAYAYIPTNSPSDTWLKNSKFTELILGDNIEKIGSNAFSDCTSLISITIPDSVTSIGEFAFCSCRSLTSIVIPDSVTSIGDYAFESCSSLTSVTIGNGVTSIGDSAFKYCSSLTSVTIGNGVTSIGNCAFYSCDSLTSVTIGNGVTSIGYDAFYDCSSLTSVTIPNSVTKIGGSAFYNCSSLKTVYCKPTTPPAGGSNNFSYNASNRKIYVPRASVDAYKSASSWSDYSSSIVGYTF